MESTRPIMRGARRGTIVVALVAALVVLQLLVVALAIAGARDQDLSVRRLEAARAYYAADAGASMAMRELVLDSDEDGDGGIGSVWSNAIGGAPAIGPAGGVSPVSVSDVGGTSVVTSSGSSGVSTRTISLSVARTQAEMGAGNGVYVEVWTLAASPGNLAGIDWTSAPMLATVMPTINLETISSGARWPGGPSSYYAIRFAGTLSVPADGAWTFQTTSGAGSALYINGSKVVDNDGVHGVQTRTGTVNLSKGPATIEVRYFQDVGTSAISASWSGPGVPGMTLIPESALSCTPTRVVPAIAVANSATFYGNSSKSRVILDGFDSTVGSYKTGNILTSGIPGAINATAAKAWNMTGYSTVNCNVGVGPGGTPSSVVSASSPASYTGTRSVLPVLTAFLNPGLPDDIPASSGSFSASKAVTINSDRHYSSMSASGSSNLNITISGNVRIVVDGDVTIGKHARIVLSSGATLDWYIGGNLTLSSTARINSAGNPRGVRIFLLGRSKDLTLQSTSQLYATVRNPFGRLVMPTPSGSSTANFYGTFHGGDILVNRYGKVHVDIGTYPQPGSTGGSGGPATSTSILSWSQTP